MKYIKIVTLFAVLFTVNGCLERSKRPIPQVNNGATTTTAEVWRSVRNGVVVTTEQQPPVGSISEVTVVPDAPIVPVEEYPIETISSHYLGGAYSNNYKLKQLINKMVTKYHFRRDYLYGIFSSVRRDTEALQKIGAFGQTKIHAKATSPGEWDRYRAQFLTTSRIGKGVKFWRENKYYLEKAQHIYGVAPEYIIGIIGVETNFGGFTGKHKVLDALTSIALEFPKRSKFFTSELEHYLLMTRKERIDAREVRGSYAGAFGLSQFMPSSFMDYAVDHDQNGQINLFSKADAIGSVANYFKEKGLWNPRIPVAVMATYNGTRFFGAKTGFKTRYTQQKLLALGTRPINNFYGYRGLTALIKLNRYTKDEMWWATENFHCIARYNPKDHYAMAVHQLAQAVRMNYYRRR